MMHQRALVGLLACLVLSAAGPSLAGLIPGFRPPSVPLAVVDPYFSIWSPYDNLTDGWSTHWTGQVMALAGGLRIDNTAYRFLGPQGGGINAPAMQQTSVQVFPLSTVYSFTQAGVRLDVTFATPAFVDEEESMSIPLTYVTFAVRSVDGRAHTVDLYFDHTAELAVSDPSHSVVWGSLNNAPSDVILRVGTQAQNILGQTGDGVKIDWGFAYLSAPKDPQLASTLASSALARNAFAAGSSLPAVDTNQPRPCNQDWIVLALRWTGLAVPASGSVVSRFLSLSYDDVYSINYFGRLLPPLWSYTIGDISTVIQLMHRQYQTYTANIQARDQQLLAWLDKRGSDAYTTSLALAYRQTTGATKFTIDPATKEVFLFMKEISSDGDVSTVDVIFPAAPFFLALNPTLVTKLMLPVLKYGNNETSIPYNLAWAPHHLGTWPVCNIAPGQQEQMPIEESGNLLLMIAAAAQRNVSLDYLQPYWPLLQTWADFLVASLPYPGNELCTDDFEGPSPNNTNLSVKGILGIGAYSLLLGLNNDHVGAAKYFAIAQNYVQTWLTAANATDHYNLQFGLPSSWSFKYNMIYDRILNLGLFPASVMQTEEAYYAKQMKAYGIPMDSRATFTKTDWESYIAAMGTNDQFLAIYNKIYLFLHNTTPRVPFTDWYETTTSAQKGFQARPVVGGLYSRELFP
ncbi:hypothetical protein CAOG_07731 [Capsaspora owczarzaki ATCC 30864]|uniref:Glutaminase GtaA n=1 Tax=Capsaspora owczarzaki (strain ATCC 30864) TaxID=595528 RepID=A0A0D2WWE7_CAPO3|nr:hypothetical protein CAOG_07731 [Capsaspora owczarzaki ATCC 30864]KJE97300.1 hypothetical protein CAOG_007731 [Capsaspora owczarzaki ATCC 30864]|eukprot:XP_004343605.2 hypothetical protein CAOG_07731 [Capsaspora owczarzaki ATCC 30864]